MATQSMIETIIERLPQLPPNIVRAIYEIATTTSPVARATQQDAWSSVIGVLNDTNRTSIKIDVDADIEEMRG